MQSLLSVIMINSRPFESVRGGRHMFTFFDAMILNLHLVHPEMYLFLSHVHPRENVIGFFFQNQI